MFTKNFLIQHAVNRGKKQISKYFVDGYAEIDGVKHVWENLGCYFHGCPNCFPPQNECRLISTTYSHLNDACMDKLVALESVYGVKVTVMRENLWLEMKEPDCKVQEFIKSYRAPEPLSPRDGLYGGRTCPSKLRYTVAPDEIVQYVDVTYLYLCVNSNFPYR